MNEEVDPMTSAGLGRRLEALAAHARDRSAKLAAEIERRQGQPAGPGDLFVLGATSGLPVEWAILERRTGARGAVLAVPADTHPLCGTGDVEVAAEAPGGPLSLRCRFGLWLDAALFEPDLRTGVLAPETVAEALQRVRQLESDTLEPSPLAEEVDADPEYQEWIGEVPERAKALAAAMPPPVVKRFPIRRWGPAHRLAAAFALVAVGLSFWVVRLSREVDWLSGPIFDAPSVNVTLGQETRGGNVLLVPRGASHVSLDFYPDVSLGIRDGYLEILRRSGESVWRSSRVRLTLSGELRLTLPRKLLPDGDYRVLVYPEAGFGARPLTVEPLRVETAE